MGDKLANKKKAAAKAAKPVRKTVADMVEIKATSPRK